MTKSLSQPAKGLQPVSPPLQRRQALAGAGAVGALAAAAAVLPLKPSPTPADGTATGAAAGGADDQGRYQVTQHVLRYYETTRI